MPLHVRAHTHTPACVWIVTYLHIHIHTNDIKTNTYMYKHKYILAHNFSVNEQMEWPSARHSGKLLLYAMIQSLTDSLVLHDYTWCPSPPKGRQIQPLTSGHTVCTHGAGSRFD